MGNDQSFMSSHSTGAVKGTNTGTTTMMLGEGSNSVWADGHVQWDSWPGALVSGYAVWVMSGRSGSDSGWVGNGNTYWRHIFVARSGKR